MNQITQDTIEATKELLKEANLKNGDILVVGCSTSEVIGKKIGSSSSHEVAEAIFKGLVNTINQDIYLAFQCCEHLNRALVVERSCAEKYNLEQVSVIPVPEAGGSLSGLAYKALEDPIVVESIKAHGGIDIGDTLIGMHLKPVAVPVRSSIKTIGKAHLTMARTRPKLIGGKRAVYK
nr:TIGR01440 family protein [Natranaerobius trueperi]